MNFWVIIISLAVGAFVGILGWTIFRSSTYVAKIRTSRFAGRSPLDDNSFYDRYYSASGLRKDIVVQLRREIETALRIPANMILPTDRFSTELSVVRGWEYADDGPDEVYLLNRDREKRLGAHIPLEELQTVDEYIRHVGALESHNSTRPSH